jgi:hypothetical protein
MHRIILQQVKALFKNSEITGRKVFVFKLKIIVYASTSESIFRSKTIDNRVIKKIQLKNQQMTTQNGIVAKKQSP